MSANKILRLDEVMKRVSVGRTFIYKGIKEGTFPKQIHLGSKSVGWLEKEIDEWIENRISESRQDEVE